MTGAATTGRRRRAHRSRLRRLDLDIVGEGERVLDEAATLVETAPDRCELWNAGGIEPSYVDHGGAVRPVRFDIEDCHDGRIVGGLHRAVDRCTGVGDYRERW